jgi:hypothetical protein
MSAAPPSSPRGAPSSLEDELDGTVDEVAVGREQLSYGKADGHVGIVTACVMYAIVGRFEGLVAGAEVGERIHVGAPGDDGTGLTALKQRDDAVFRDSGLHFVEAERAEFFGYDARRPDFAIGEFGVLMKITAHRDDSIA